MTLIYGTVQSAFERHGIGMEFALSVCRKGETMSDEKKMDTEEVIAELQNMRKFNYTLAPDEVFTTAISALRFRDAWLMENVERKDDDRTDF